MVLAPRMGYSGINRYLVADRMPMKNQNPP